MKTIIFILFIFITGCSVTTTYWKMPVEYALIEINNMHFVRVTFNDKPTLFLFDTGASKSVIDITKAEEYGFEHARFSKQQYVGIGGEVDIYNVYEYKVKEIWITFLGADLSEITTSFEKEGMPILGIIGSDFIKTYNVSVDFKNNIMYLNN